MIWDRVGHLPMQFIVNGAILAVGGIAAGLSAGRAQAAGFVAGVALVVASYTASTLAIAWADSVNPRLVLPVGMAMYVTKFTLFGVLLVVVNGTEWAGRIPMALGIVAAVVCWTAGQIWWTVRVVNRQDLVDHDAEPP